MQRSVFDKNGKSYKTTILESGSLLIIRLFDQEDVVGEIKCVQELPAQLLIGDILIKDDVILSPPNIWSAFIRTVSGFHPKPVNYRNRGLGSALLQLLIEHARANGTRKLYGKVVQQDIQNTPSLLQWYQKHGFEVKLLPTADADGTVAWIHLVLNRY